MTAALGGGLLTLAGCLQLLAIDGDVTVAHDTSDAGADAASVGTPACGLVVAGASCEACLNAHCCPQMAACGAIPECANFETCVLSCGTDYACRARCNSADASRNFVQIPPLESCVADECQGPCGLSCGLVESIAAPDAAVACEACIAANPNCAAAEACGQSLDCLEAAQCAGACVTLDCQQACTNAHDAGGPLLTALESTLAAACLGPCQFGESWGCVGHVVVPFAPGTTVVTVTVATVEGAPVPGATVKACNAADVPCATPLSTGTTDANGAVILSVRGPLPIGDGFGGYFDITPQASPDGGPPQIVPFLEFLSHPFTEPTALFAATALTPADLALFTLQGQVSVDGGPMGDIVLVGLDCGLHPASGVAFQATSGTRDLTPQIRYPSATMLDPTATVTTALGLAILFDVPALENVTLTAIPTALGRPSGTTQGFARSGGYSIVSIPPEPTP